MPTDASRQLESLPYPLWHKLGVLSFGRVPPWGKAAAQAWDCDHCGEGWRHLSQTSFWVPGFSSPVVPGLGPGDRISTSTWCHSTHHASYVSLFPIPIPRSGLQRPRLQSIFLASPSQTPDPQLQFPPHLCLHLSLQYTSLYLIP